MKSILREYPVTAYFILTFLLSWSAIVVVSFFMGMPTTKSQFESVGPIALVPMLLAPTVVSLFLTGFLKGGEGLRELRSRLTKWKVPVKWYLFALLFVPAVLGIILLALSQFSDVYIPKIISERGKTEIIITGVLTGLIGGGLLEELGWTGFAIPEMMKRFDILKTGLVVGFLWGLWHFLPVYWGSGNASGNLDGQLFFSGLYSNYGVLIPFRIILVWLHQKTASLIPVILMHATLTTFLLFIFNVAVSGYPLLLYHIIFSVFLWVTVIIMLKKQIIDSDALGYKV